MESLGSYRGPVREHWPTLAEKVVERLSTGEPVDFAALLRESRD
jgi:hypothetical protein